MLTFFPCSYSGTHLLYGNIGNNDNNDGFFSPEPATAENPDGQKRPARKTPSPEKRFSRSPSRLPGGGEIHAVALFMTVQIFVCAVLVLQLLIYGLLPLLCQRQLLQPSSSSSSSTSSSHSSPLLNTTTLGKDAPSNNNTNTAGPAKDIAAAVAEARHAREAREAAKKQGELVAQAAAAAAAEAREQVRCKKKESS